MHHQRHQPGLRALAQMAPGLEAPGPAVGDRRRQRQPELSDGRVRRAGFPERELRELFGMGGVGGWEL